MFFWLKQIFSIRICRFAQIKVHVVEGNDEYEFAEKIEFACLNLSCLRSVYFINGCLDHKSHEKLVN